MQVAVFADIEGAFGIWRRRQCHTGTREWQYGRQCLTEDVNAVVAGAFDGGAGGVTVKDTHDTGFNLIASWLDPRARYIGGHFVEPTFFGDVLDCELVLYVAIHAAAGTEGAFFPHTHYGIFSAVRLDGEAVCEMELYGAYLGELGLPIGMVSGDQLAVAQARRALPWIKSVSVDKREATYTAGEQSARYLTLGRQRLRQAAAAAVAEAGAGTMKPLVRRGPIAFELEFRDEQTARRCDSWGVERQGATVRYDAANMIAGFERLNQLTFYDPTTYPIRSPLLVAMRGYFFVKNNFFAPSSEPGGAEPQRTFKHRRWG